MFRTFSALACSTVVILAGTVSAETTTPELRMIHSQCASMTQGSDSFGVFTPEGPNLGTLMPAPSRVDFVTWDPANDTWYGQQTSTLGTLDPSGTFTELEVPESVRLSHSGGLAFDTMSQSVLVASKSGAGMMVFSYDPAEGAWRELGNFGREPLHGLACDGARGMLFTLEKSRDGEHCQQLHIYNRNGARVATRTLSTPIPFISSLNAKVQLGFEHGEVFALTSHHEHPRLANGLWRIDPASGQVTRTPYNASLDLTTKTWPGWKEGPAPSSQMAACGARGTGGYSNYETPASLVSGQPSELHVIAIGTGAVNHLEWLKKVRKVSASTKDGGVSVSVELDPNAESQPPVVEVFVGQTEKPVTLALLSRSPVTWSIDTSAGGTVQKIVTFKTPFMTESPVIGVDASLVASGGDASAAHAWELERSSVAVGFDEMISLVRTATGLRENTFQGMSRAEAIRVPAQADFEVTSVDAEE